MSDFKLHVAPATNILFGPSGELGCIDLSGPEMKFTGNADASARVFMDALKGLFDERVKAAVLAERERCAQIAQYMPDGAWPPSGLPDEIAAEIRKALP